MTAHDTAVFIYGYLACLASVALACWLGEKLKSAALDAVAHDTPQLRRFEEQFNARRELAHEVYTGEWT